MRLLQTTLYKFYISIFQFIANGQFNDEYFYQICTNKHLDIIKFIFDNNLVNRYKARVLFHTCATDGLEQLKWIIDNKYYPETYDNPTVPVEEYDYMAHLRDVSKMEYLYSRGFTNIGGFVFQNSLNTPYNLEVFEWLKSHGFKFDYFDEEHHVISSY